MNNSRKLASLLFTGTLAVLAVPAFAQSSTTTPSSGSSASQTEPYRGSTGSAVSGSSSTSGTGSMSGAGQQSGSTSGTLSNSTSQSSSMDFTSLDSDQDGRISLSEFTAQGSSSSSVSGSASSSDVNARSSGSSSWSSDDKSKKEEKFRKADTDRDGYLSAAELAACQAEKASKDADKDSSSSANR
jgi:Ca2+-binding EF-hand superfamily protein